MKITSASMVVLLLLFCHPAFADQTSHRKAVEELFVLTGTPKMMDSVKSQTKRIILQQLNQQNIPEAKKPVFNKYMSKIVDLITETLSWRQIKSKMEDLYVNNFTENEINDMLAFYKSPTGQKFVEKMPVIMTSAMEIGQKQSQIMMPKLNTLIQQMKKELEQK